jgi:hypothetical protein
VPRRKRIHNPKISNCNSLNQGGMQIGRSTRCAATYEFELLSRPASVRRCDKSVHERLAKDTCSGAPCEGPFICVMGKHLSFHESKVYERDLSFLKKTSLIVARLSTLGGLFGSKSLTTQ